MTKARRGTGNEAKAKKSEEAVVVITQVGGGSWLMLHDEPLIAHGRTGRLRPVSAYDKISPLL